jgi:hypothetical protein
MTVTQRYAAAFRKVAPPIFLGALPVILVVWALALAARNDNVAVDFHHELYPQAQLVLDGANPYPSSDAEITDTSNAAWPVAAALLVAPLTVLPAAGADWVMTFLLIAAFAAALLIIGVRDWRVFGATFLWPPLLNGVQTANLTLFLSLLAAVVWRYRDRRWLAGAALGVAIACKFFLWPLVIWLGSLRRYAAAVLACAIGAVSLLLIQPFVPVSDYLRFVGDLSDAFDGESYTLYAALTDAGAPSGLAHAATMAVGATLLVLAWRFRSFALAIGAALVLSPIVWLHFFALLALPLAVAVPRFGWPWLLPLAFWLVPGTYNGAPWQTVLALVVLGATITVTARREISRDTRRPEPRLAVQRPLTSTR